MRVFGVLTLGFCVVLFGFYLTNNLIKKLKQINKIIYFIEYIYTKIRYSKTTISEIFNSIDDKDFEFLMLNVNDYKSICFNNPGLLLNKDEKNYLFEFFSSLGKTDVDSQLEHCLIYKETFKKVLEINEKECNKKIKMYPSLFVLLGLLLIILLI